jgi:flavin reductase (DIM6/NTAB) family NADH-FMN oxidoreductase RutF
MLTLDPKDIPTPVLQSYLQGVIAPRPIAFASTIDKEGNVNLSPFSFFNIFSTNPPILIFSPARRVRDNTTKHTLENVLEVPEVVINIVNYAMVQQASLSSTEYPKGVNEFVKVGLTETPSAKVKPPRVAESPASFECIVKDVIKLGDKGGAGNLILCEIILAHFDEDILNAERQVDPFKLDAVARMGGDWYCRANGESIFKVPKPLQQKGIGVDQIPEPIRKSNVLTGNDLGRLGNVESLPDAMFIETVSKEEEVQLAKKSGKESLHLLAHTLLKEGEVKRAWAVLLV